MGTGVLMAAMLAAGATPEPLPDHIDIPDEFSTVICPDQQSAKTMLDQYHSVKPAPNNHMLDIPLFFAGLNATGCAQNGPARKGVVTIKSVQQRKKLDLAGDDGRYIRYSGTDAAGNAVIGIVHEDANNGYPRTPLAEWLSERAVNGWLDASFDGASNFIFYRCDTPAKANAAVTATKGLENAKLAVFEQKLAKAAAQQGCRRANDRYQVTALLSTSGNDCGHECYVDLTAIAATDRSGLTVGLIFDASLM